MKLLRLLALSALLGLFAAAPASAQYIYMDSNGDGVHTAADVMNPNGTPTTVDFWVNTAHNKDGSLAVCDTGDGNLDTWNSYAIHVSVLNGTATFTNYVNQQPTFVTGCADAGNVFFKTDNATIMSACAATGTATPNGGVNLKMATVTVTGATGSPSLEYTPSNTLDQNFTSFGTPCSGHDFDNTYKLGPLPGGAGPGDFTDNDGIGPAPGGNSPPAITAPATATGTELQAFTVSATATDADAADILTITATGQPSDLTFSSTPHVSPATATISGTLGLNDQGTHTITWSVSDGHNPPVTATTVLTVTNVDQAPVVTAPATESVAAGSPLSFTVTASDPDAEAILALTASGTAVTAGGTFTSNATHTSGTFAWTPTAGQTGTFDVTFTATNALSGTATTQITVTGGGADQPPVVTAPATETGSENNLLTFTVTATDPDGQAITSLTAAPLPSGATFTANASNTAGTFIWTPGFTQAGAYSVTFTASNALSGTATTAITIANTDRAPVVTAPTNESGTEGTLLTFTVTASDPDGDAITSLTASSLPTGATFTANGTNTSGTFSWTPSAGQAGVYDVTFTASNALSGSATTALTITAAGADHPPVVTAPATETGTEGTLLSFTVTASDPDGQAITSLTAAPLPTGATFTANGTNTAGTFTWTPSAGQAGAYDVTFTASNALTGSATTHITISAAAQDHAPVVTAPATETGTEGSLLTFTVTASDPDGDAIATLTAAPLPSGATFTSNASHTSGTFSWTPSAGQAGSYSVTFTASNALSGSATTNITISAQTVNHAPVVTAPATETVDEGQLLTFTVTATDADGDHVTLTATGVPSGATFTDNGNNTGTFTWTPSFSQSGTYTVTFTGNDGHGGTGTANTVITVNNVNTGGGGTATATLIGNFNSHRRFLCFRVVPTSGSFDVHNVDLGSVTLNFGGSSITAQAAQTHVEADCDSEGTEECEDCGDSTNSGASRFDFHRAAAQCDTTLQVCFLMSDVVGLFGSQSIPDNLANATITGSLTTGGTFTATIGAPRVAGRDASGDRKLHSRAKPNPLNPKTDLTFTLAQPGLVRVSVFDAQGRLVKTLLNETRPAGENVVAWDGSDAKGGHVASGVFFFRVQALGAQDIVRVTVLK